MLKKTEIILASILLIAFAMKLSHIPGSAALFILSGSSLSLLYNIFSFLLFNDIKLRNLTKRNAYKNTSVSTIIMAIFIGFSISSLFTGFIFKIMLWPGGAAMLNAGLIMLVICALISLFIQPKVINSFENIHDQELLNNNENILDSELFNKEVKPINFNFRKNVLLRIIPVIIVAIVVLIFRK